ncbi:MerR family DNA-binding protein [Paractinoplanes brasiliensis]
MPSRRALRRVSLILVARRLGIHLADVAEIVCDAADRPAPTQRD